VELGFAGWSVPKNEWIQQDERPLGGGSFRTKIPGPDEYKTHEPSHFLKERYVVNIERPGSERIYFEYANHASGFRKQSGSQIRAKGRL
jgi:hypothetical protein